MAWLPGTLHCTSKIAHSVGDCHTPPSLAHSDTSSDDLQPLKLWATSTVFESGRFDYQAFLQEGLEGTDGMAKNSSDDLHAVIDDVIVKINRISDHLRCAGQNEAANNLNRDMTRAFRSLYDVIARWDNGQCQMVPSRKSFPIEGDGTTQPSHQALSQPAHTWAAVAATAPSAEQDNIVKFRPSDGGKCAVSKLEQTRQASQDRRVVWVAPWPEQRPYAEITKAIEGLGALFSIAYSPEAHGICIIFQHASAADEFLRLCADYAGSTGRCRFGSGVTVQPGALYPYNRDIKRMENPMNERRRLTFARQQLFSNGLTEQVFRKEIESLVGGVYIELLWLFNTGNATVVFSAVPLARLVRDTFRHYALNPQSPYFGVMVSYSHDPCERALHLVTQMPGHPESIANGNSNGGHDGYNKEHQNRHRGSSTFATDASNTSRRHSLTSASPLQRPNEKVNGGKAILDSDGWQVVHGKKR